MHCILTWRQVRLHTFLQALWYALWDKVLNYRGLHMDFADLDSSLFLDFFFCLSTSFSRLKKSIYHSYVYFPFVSSYNPMIVEHAKLKYVTKHNKHNFTEQNILKIILATITDIFEKQKKKNSFKC